MSSDRWGQEVPTLFEESACVQHGQLAGVNIQLQTGRVRKSRPFLKNQLDSQLACLQAVGVRKSRPFLKTQHGFSAVCLPVCISTLLEESACVQHSQLAGVPLQPQTARVMKS